MGYHSRMEPSFRLNTDPVLGQIIPYSWVNLALMKPSEYAPSAGERDEMA